MNQERIALDQLRPGNSARIFQMDLVAPLLKSRLSDLGVEEGTAIKIKSRIPFGGPITLEAAGQLIGIRQSDAARIEVFLS
ncbi:FeoA family protein [Paenibacillus caui]|uniref:FeoA family protein n=1 Tax=Paenibacillus caui TaxID=2873927 RepID=UPI001F17EB33|nr:FeoA family protein [Paenibacillus caui]